MVNFRIATRSYIDEYTNKRAGETKLGERVACVHSEDWEEQLKNSPARFVLLGIPEDIGVRANYGLGGTYTMWEPALKAILNVQHMDKLDGADLLVLGAFDFSDMMKNAEKKDADELRELVPEIDAAVTPVIQKVIQAGKIPVIIGGGHNNAFPILQGAAQALNVSLNCINLDAHSDYRKMEGRHSGNGFRYAKAKGYLKKYAVVGLHENYNAQNIVDDLAADQDLHWSFYEDIFVRNKLSFIQAVRDAIVHTSGSKTGIELDIDCIEYALSSAVTPVGITALQARQYIHTCAEFCDVAYLHITEGAVKLRNGNEDAGTAKLVAYLVADFVKAYDSK
ncbi:MAG: formimidoylglutamase [Bacteroidetes bacterium]|nr:formimidoylglutamase [Bacteroidota bacterium]